MNRTLYQLLGEDIEELWYFPTDITEEKIQELYNDYCKNWQWLHNSFEEFMKDRYYNIDCERVFVTIINI